MRTISVQLPRQNMTFIPNLNISADYSSYDSFDRPSKAVPFPSSNTSIASRDICPSKRRGLVPLPPGPEVHLSGNVAYIVDRNTSVNSITITDGGLLA